MSDEPSNAASEFLRSMCAYYNTAGSPPEKLVRASVTDDFVYEDRRSGPTFPDADAGSLPRYLNTYWETGAGQPRFEFEILAVRGARCAAGILRVDFGNGMLRESIIVMILDATLRLAQRTVDVDLDDVDVAIAELDRMHSQADAS